MGIGKSAVILSHMTYTYILNLYACGGNEIEKGVEV